MFERLGLVVADKCLCHAVYSSGVLLVKSEAHQVLNAADVRLSGCSHNPPCSYDVDDKSVVSEQLPDEFLFLFRRRRNDVSSFSVFLQDDVFFHFCLARSRRTVVNRFPKLPTRF